MELHRQGAVELLIAFAILVASFEFIRIMLDTLQKSLNVDLVDSASIMNRVFTYYEAHPVLCLSLNFGIVFAIGAFFLYLEDIRKGMRRLQDKLVRLSRYGYMEIDRQEASGMLNGFFTEATFAKRSKLHMSMNYVDAFAVLDKDKSGSVDAKELRETLNRSVSEEDITRAIARVDENGDGELQLDEFKQFWGLLQAAHARAQHQKQEQRDQLETLARGEDIEAGVPEAAAAAASAVPGKPSIADDTALSQEDLKEELRATQDQADELDIQYKVRYRKNPTTTEAKECSEKLKRLQTRCQNLQSGLMGIRKAVVTHAEASGDAHAQGKEAAKQAGSPASSPGFVGRLMKSALLQILMRSANGIFSVGLYFADLVSDVQVSVLLWTTGNYAWSGIGIFLLVFQFLIVELRVLPYLQSTFGSNSSIYLFFLVFGFPWGLLALDCLMFCEPFGLLAILPFPEWLRQFIPAYKATRIIAEVVIESLPQCILQSYIYVVVIYRTQAGTASDSELAMLEFAAVLPTSILISTIAMLKLWIEVIAGARAAGLTIGAKALQLWEVGAGLPLDALKKGTIVEWKCPYHLDGAEISPLIDALSRNSSLISLDLTLSGLTWVGTKATGMPLLEQLNQSPATLSALKHLKLSAVSGCIIPIARLRKGGDEAIEALKATPFFIPGGAWREEIFFVADMLRQNVDGPITAYEEIARERIITMCVAAKTGRLKRDAWKKELCSMIVEGSCRRGHLFTLVTAETLRSVGFAASELLSAGFNLAELRIGGFTADGLKAAGLKAHELKLASFSASELRMGTFTAKELRMAGFTPIELSEGGYSPKLLKEAGISAAELKDNGFDASQLKEGTFDLRTLKPLFTADDLRKAMFTAKEMREAGFTLEELVNGGYPAADLRNSGYYCSEMREVGFFSIADLRTAGYSGAEMRIAGYVASELRDAGFGAKKIKGAGYSAVEAIGTGWSIEVLKSAGYEAGELRDAKCSALSLKAVGFTLIEMRAAGYSTQELQAIGYGAEELRKVGVSLNDLAMAGSSVADLKAAGISVIGLKAEGLPLKELKEAGYADGSEWSLMASLTSLLMASLMTSLMGSLGASLMTSLMTSLMASLIRSLMPSLMTSLMTSLMISLMTSLMTSLMASLITSECISHQSRIRYPLLELKAAGYTTQELRQVGFDAATLMGTGINLQECRVSGFSAHELFAAGCSVRDLRECGFNAAALKKLSLKAEDLLAGGFSVVQLKDAGFSAPELRAADLGASELRAAGFATVPLKEAGFNCKQMIAAGFKARELYAEGKGYAPDELKQAGFSAKVLATADISVDELITIGFVAADLTAAGFTVAQLREKNYKVKALLELGYTLPDLKTGGFPVKALRHAKISTPELLEAGFKWHDLKEGGCSAEDLKTNGATVKELKDIGFGVEDLLRIGCTIQQMRLSGFRVNELRQANVSAKLLEEAGFSAFELRDGGFSMMEIRACGLRIASVFSIKEMKAGGISLLELKEHFDIKDLAQFYSLSELRMIGTKLLKMKQAGYSTTQLKNGGYTTQEFHAHLYSCSDLREAGFTAAEIKAGGYTTSEIKLAGFDVSEMRQVSAADCH